MLQKSVISSIFQKLPALVQPRLYLFRYKWPFPIGRVLETNDAACSATFYQLINIQGQFWFLLLDKSADPKFICNFCSANDLTIAFWGLVNWNKFVSSFNDP